MENKGIGKAWIVLIIFLVLVLLAIIFVPAMTYFGIFSPDNKLPDSLILNLPFSPGTFSIKTDGIEFEVKYLGNDNILINSIEVTNCGKKEDLSIKSSPEELKKLNIGCELEDKSEFRGDIILIYVSEGSIISQSTNGMIRGRVSS